MPGARRPHPWTTGLNSARRGAERKRATLPEVPELADGEERDVPLPASSYGIERALAKYAYRRTGRDFSNE